MIRKKIMIISGMLLIGILGSRMQAMNLLQPYETLIRPDYNNEHAVQFYTLAEAGFNTHTYSNDGAVHNALRMYECEQDALEMLNGFCDTSVIGQKRIQINANDNGVRGHFLASGDLQLRGSLALALRCFFRTTWSIGLYLPFYAMRLKNVCWLDLTQNLTDDDMRVHEFLTNNFFQNVAQLGSGLDLNGWDRAGVGDFTVLAEWFQDFPQNKQVLSNVRINWRAGVLVPTGKRQDEDKILAFAFGSDGAFGIPFGVGLDLTFAKYLKAGFDVQLWYLFGNTRARRVKTTFDQTELLLLEKVQAYKDYGMTQRFNLYVETMFRGFSFLVGYQYLKHGEDLLWPCSDAVDYNVINSALSLQDWTLHQIFVNAQYDFGDRFEGKVRPQLGLFMRFPFNGKRTVSPSTIGCMISFDF